MPTSMRMHAANGDPIDIHGAVILRISGHRSGMRRETRQFVYITPTTDAMYLSRDACRDLGMIDAAFPADGLASISADGDNTDESCTIALVLAVRRHHPSQRNYRCRRRRKTSMPYASG